MVCRVRPPPPEGPSKPPGGDGASLQVISSTLVVPDDELQFYTSAFSPGGIGLAGFNPSAALDDKLVSH